MALLTISSNHNSTLNCQCVLNQRLQYSSSFACGKTWCHQKFVEVNDFFADIKGHFVDLFKHTSSSPREDLCVTETKIFNPVIDQLLHELTVNKCHINLVIMADEKSKRKSFLTPNTKYKHLFDIIRTFKTERHIEKGFFTKLKEFFGIGIIRPDPKSQVSKDLNKFFNNLKKENSEQNQKTLLAFVEGYMTAKDNAAHQKSRWKIYNISLTALTLGLMYYFFKKSSIGFGPVFDPAVSTELSESTAKFNDVKGADEAKEELKNVVEFLKNPTKFSVLGGKLPKGVLLVGPPGTGKTLLAKAVAGEAGVPFFSKSGPEFDEIYVGIGARRIRELFKLAKENVPCVIFIDEIDSIGKERTSSAHHPHANDTLNQLLTEMDGFRNNSGIIILGATNRKNDLDRALLRPGRFDVEVNVSIPDYNGRKELFDHYLSRVRHQDVSAEKLARGTTSFTGADIENIVNQAALKAAVVGAQYVTMEHLEYAIDKLLMGPEKVTKIMDDETNRITAYHEGGHTVVGYFTKNALPLHKVTIIARGDSLGHTSYLPDKDIYHITKTQLLAMIDTMMGGRAAEELIFGSEKITSGAANDLQKATDLASKMVQRWGMSDEVGLTTYSSTNPMSPQTANLIDTEVKKLLQESYERAKNILTLHKDKHKELSEALLKYETLDAEEIETIMKGKFIKRPKKT